MYTEFIRSYVFASKNFVHGAYCEYCSNTARHLTKTNAGFLSRVCNFHLVLYGKVTKEGL